MNQASSLPNGNELMDQLGRAAWHADGKWLVLLVGSVFALGIARRVLAMRRRPRPWR